MLFIGVAIFQGIFGQSNQNAPAWALVAVYFATLIVHELVHGLGFLLSGAKPKFGVGFVGIMPFAYATSGSNSKIPLKKNARNGLFTICFVVYHIYFARQCDTRLCFPIDGGLCW